MEHIDEKQLRVIQEATSADEEKLRDGNDQIIVIVHGIDRRVKSFLYYECSVFGLRSLSISTIDQIQAKAQISFIQGPHYFSSYKKKKNSIKSVIFFFSGYTVSIPEIHLILDELMYNLSTISVPSTMASSTPKVKAYATNPKSIASRERAKEWEDDQITHYRKAGADRTALNKCLQFPRVHSQIPHHSIARTR